jgi:hypothetical protein
MRVKPLFVAAALVTFPVVSSAQHGDLTHEQPAVPDAFVDFGVLPTEPLGPAATPPLLGCAQAAAAIGGPGDPCAFKIHHLTPEEVTIFKDGQVTFQIHGGGHAMAIYEVSKDTTRDQLGQFLCAGVDPGTLTDPNSHVCNGTTPAGAANANAQHNIADGKGNVVIVAEANITNVHPQNRVWSEPNRLMSAGGVQFLNGGTVPSGFGVTGGQLITYRFLKTGRYLVICMNRSHFLNDWMFGFVNVTGQ